MVTPRYFNLPGVVEGVAVQLRCFCSLRLSPSACAVVFSLPKRTLDTSWRCLPRLLLHSNSRKEKKKRSNYQVSTPFSPSAVVIVFLRCSSVMIMHCELNLTHTFVKQSRI